MKKIFLTSDMGCSYKENGIRYVQKINNANGIIEQIKSRLNDENVFLFVCSNPDTYELNDNYARLTFDSFNMSGFNFKKLIVVDHRYNGSLIDDMKKANIVFLSGGHTLTEMEHFNEIGLKELLMDYDGVIIGQSAGSMNLAKTVICAPEYEDEVGGKYVWDGLGLTEINVEPHFKLEIDESEDIFRQELLKLSIDNNIYAICDGSHIAVDGNEDLLYGEGYLIHNKEITKLNNDKAKFIISSYKDDKNSRILK